MTVNGRAYRRQLWAPAISEIGGGLLPTPKAWDGDRGRDKARARPDDRGRELATVLRDRMLPTPQARDPRIGSPPGTNRWERKQQEGWSPNLNDIAPALLTPTATDYKGPTNWQAAGRNGPQRLSDSLPTGAGLYLNPSFVEEMMGFPLDWTKLED